MGVAVPALGVCPHGAHATGRSRFATIDGGQWLVEGGPPAVLNWVLLTPKTARHSPSSVRQTNSEVVGGPPCMMVHMMVD